MNKINNWDSVKLPEQGTGRRLVPGPYLIKILRVEDLAASMTNPKNSLRIEFDIIEGDFKNYYNDKYQADDRRDKKWAGFFYVNYDEKEEVLRWFKAFITSVEESNTGYKWNWLPQSLVGKVVCYAFGEVEKELPDKRKSGAMSVVKIVSPRFPHSVRAYRDGRVATPKPRLLASTSSASSSTFSTPTFSKQEITDNLIDQGQRAWGEKAVENKKPEVVGVVIDDDESLPF